MPIEIIIEVFDVYFSFFIYSTATAYIRFKGEQQTNENIAKWRAERPKMVNDTGKLNC